MTAHLTSDPERVLDAYAEATRVVATPELIRRFQAGVHDERTRSASRPWSAVSAWVEGARLRLGEPFQATVANHVTFALRLQSLALILLTVLALGALVGGAGAVVASLVSAPDRGAPVPNRVLAPLLSSPAVFPAPVHPVASPMAPVMPSPVASPTVTVEALPQRAPRRPGRRATNRAHVSRKATTTVPSLTVERVSREGDRTDAHPRREAPAPARS